MCRIGRIDYVKILIELLKNQSDHYLVENEYVLGYSFYYLTEGLIQHDIYRLEQIGL
jgi:uncharacterized membrane protein